MKQNLLVILFATIQLCSFGQSPFTGIWEGKINVGVNVRLVFTIREDASQKFTAVMDMPDQGVNAMVSKNVSVSKDSIVINIKEFDATYTGVQINDTTIQGKWQKGISTDLELRKVEKVKLIQRPQTPVLPFPYKSEDVIFTNNDKTIQYGATITIPNGNGPFPAVVLITGSGQQNRDEQIAGHKPFAVIADHLTRNGFIVFRVDDRGIGQTTGDVLTATTLDFCGDINTSIEYLRSRKEVDKKRLALIGHSEGGMIAQMLASARKDIAAIVLLAAPGKSGEQVLVEQNRAFYANAGLPADYVNSYASLFTSILQHSKGESDIDKIKSKVAAETESWIKTTPKNVVVATTGIFNEEKKTEFINKLSEMLNIPWVRYFLNFQPAEYLKKVTCKVFALNGARDIQVLSQSNLTVIEAALKVSKSQKYQIKEYEGLNHLFQKCKTCASTEYGMLDETISVEVLKDITSWLISEM
jgi:pimeloyl-ACP methyl ester carboxylesterase